MMEGDEVAFMHAQEQHISQPFPATQDHLQLGEGVEDRFLGSIREMHAAEAFFGLGV